MEFIGLLKIAEMFLLTMFYWFCYKSDDLKKFNSLALYLIAMQLLSRGD